MCDLAHTGYSVAKQLYHSEHISAVSSGSMHDCSATIASLYEITTAITIYSTARPYFSV